ncbi:MAG TPA: hypothetical protein VMU25_01585 [Candidatus Paceibacterota bacterium]|nr:hypothetical protein [Candidatus Paceibacterota bacterium]
MNMRRLIGSLAVALAALLIPVAAFAEIGLKIQPVKISETLNPGESTSGVITLTNVSDQDVNVAVTVQDFVPVANSDTYQFVGRAPGVSSVRDWINVGTTTSFNFKQGETRDIPYTITAPQDAEPGGHFGAVFFKATGSGQSSIKVGTQVGMLVLVAIPGSHTESGNILSFTAPAFLQQAPVPFTMKFQNTGTVFFEPRGTIDITDMFGRTVANLPIQGEVVLPTTIKTMEFDWNVSGFLLGKYTAVATIIDGEGNKMTTSAVSFWVVPVWYILAFLVVLIVIFFVLRFLKRRVKISVSLT